MNLIKVIFCILCLIFSINLANANLYDNTENILKRELETHSLVVIKDGYVNWYDGRGIKPLLNYLKTGNFENAYVGDKKIGKASALLLVYGKAKRVYTPIISRPAIEVFEKYNVNYTTEQIVDNILNRSKTGLCPMEKKVKNIDSPEKAFKVLNKR